MEVFYETFVVREMIERLERQRDLTVSSLYGNSVFDENEGARRDEAIRKVNEQFDQMVEYIIAMQKGESVGEEIDEDNQFWAAAKRGVDRLEYPRSDEDEPGITAGDMIEEERSLEEVRSMMASMDQP